jgi:hypothetical protein
VRRLRDGDGTSVVRMASWVIIVIGRVIVIAQPRNMVYSFAILHQAFSPCHTAYHQSVIAGCRMPSPRWRSKSSISNASCSSALFLEAKGM